MNQSLNSEKEKLITLKNKIADLKIKRNRSLFFSTTLPIITIDQLSKLTSAHASIYYSKTSAISAIALTSIGEIVSLILLKERQKELTYTKEEYIKKHKLTLKKTNT